ncbi:MAG: hypothetical protein JO010_12265 [Alphaproteobacteria bacterium]|nr:hypothetical protein [Alphaproteobacteria bacterium]
MNPEGAAPAKTDELPPVASLVSVPLRKNAALVTPPATPAPEARGGGRTVIAGEPAALIAWWNGLKRGRLLPAPEDLDHSAIAGAWPEALLLECDAAQDAILRATRLGAAAPSQFIEYSPMVTEWLLALGRKTMQRAAALHETRSFPVGAGLAAYCVVTLPLSAGGRGIDHILCAIGPG